MKNDSSLKHLAHDLNNIFTRILNSVDLLKRKAENIDSFLPLLNNIEAGTFLASEMIEETLGLSTKTFVHRTINLNSVIKDVIRSFNLQNKIEFRFNSIGKLKMVKGKYSDFYRLILNLLTNSVEAIKNTGTISITTNNLDESESIEIKIKDTGSGINQSALSHIFDEDFSTKGKKIASGLGLTIVKKIIDDYNGKISVISSKGIGTEFTILLPAVKYFEKNTTGDGKAILIAEDEIILRDLLADLLESYNYTVITSSSGLGVLDQLKIRTPDLLIIDKKMPDMDGITCIQEIKKSNCDIPIILASGSPTESTAILTDKINKTINKPYNFDELLNLVRELIG